MTGSLTFEALWDGMRADVAEALGARSLRAAPFGTTGLVADNVTRIAVRSGDKGSPLGVAIVSSEADPGAAIERARREAEAAALLGPDAGSVVLCALRTGETEGLTYALYRWARPMARTGVRAALEARLLGPALLRWLREAVARTASPGDAGAFEAALGHASESDDYPAGLRDAARDGLGRLRAGSWAARHVLDHNDLWKGNVLLRPVGESAGAYPFFIIDWPGANPRGFGYYDLIRLARSLGLGRARLRREAEAHAGALGEERWCAGARLGAALGRVGLCAGHMPRERVRMIASNCWEQATRSGVVA